MSELDPNITAFLGKRLTFCRVLQESLPPNARIVFDEQQDYENLASKGIPGKVEYQVLVRYIKNRCPVIRGFHFFVAWSKLSRFQAPGLLSEVWQGAVEIKLMQLSALIQSEIIQENLQSEQ